MTPTELATLALLLYQTKTAKSKQQIYKLEEITAFFPDAIKLWQSGERHLREFREKYAKDNPGAYVPSSEPAAIAE